MRKKFILPFLLFAFTSWSQTNKRIYEDERLTVLMSPFAPGPTDTIVLQVSYSSDKIIPSGYTAESRLYNKTEKNTGEKKNVLKVSFWWHCSHGVNPKNYYEIRIPPLSAGQYTIEFVSGELYMDSRAYDTAKHCYEVIGVKTTVTVK
jgi:hypothetical protein